MKKRVERLRGMYDALPEAYQQQRWLTDRLSRYMAQAGFALVDTPLLERSDLFLASFGQELWQNLYAFRLHQRDLCLRPEYTASICRLYLDHYQQQPLPLRFQYAGPIFRYEEPGRERYRQHTQLGVEIFGGQIEEADAELLQMACDVLEQLRISDYRLELGHIGVASGFISRLNLDDQAARLLLRLMEQISRSGEGELQAQKRLEELYPSVVSGEQSVKGQFTETETGLVRTLLNGLSISFGDADDRRVVVERFLWKMGRAEQRRQILDALEFLKELHAVSGPPPEVFQSLRELLERYSLDAEPLLELERLVEIIEQSGVPREKIILNLSLGRGVSYYTGLVFEIHASDSKGNETQLCGGGRYDRLMRAVGSERDVRACGFAFRLERLIALIPQDELPVVSAPTGLVVPVKAQEFAYALQVARRLRTQGIAIELDISGHSVGESLKRAITRRIPYALIVGESEKRDRTVTLRDLENGEESILALEGLQGYFVREER